MKIRTKKTCLNPFWALILVGVMIMLTSISMVSAVGIFGSLSNWTNFTNPGSGLDSYSFSNFTTLNITALVSGEASTVQQRLTWKSYNSTQDISNTKFIIINSSITGKSIDAGRAYGPYRSLSVCDAYTDNCNNYTIPTTEMAGSCGGEITNSSDDGIEAIGFTIPNDADKFYIMFKIYTQGACAPITQDAMINSIIKELYFSSNGLFSLVDNTYSLPFLNITFKDESTSEIINGSITSSHWTIYSNNILNNRTILYSNNTEHFSYSFGFLPKYSATNLTYSINYKSTGYAQRTFGETIQIDNSTTNKILYLLKNIDGIYVTFQVINVAEQPLSNTHVTVIQGDSTVGDGYTDTAGSITFFLNPDLSHTFTFNATGYDLYTTTLTPTQSGYTIVLGATTTASEDYQRGIGYSTGPAESTLINRTDYTFNFTTTSSYWTIESFGFRLYNASGTLLATDSSTANGGTVSSVVNTGNLSIIYMDYYWSVDGNYQNATRYWKIFNEADSGWSIKNFFTDLKNYTDDEIFGLTAASRAILVFFFIFITVGVLSYKFGVTSPGMIAVMVFVLVLFFDVGVGIMPTLTGAVTHFITIFMALILIGVFIWEFAR